MKKILMAGLASVTMLLATSGAANATLSMKSSGGASLSGTPLNLAADLTIAGDILTIHLHNNSTMPSDSPDDLLSGFFFDISKNGVRPTLSYASANGAVYLTAKTAPDTLIMANANLKAVTANDNTWQYRALNPALTPNYGFGLATVGNNNFGGNGFNGHIVGGMDYSIYAGDITTHNLTNRLLVKNQASFVFSGLSGFSEADIGRSSLFSLGTSPDSTLPGTPTPEPATMLLLGSGLAGLMGVRRRG